jgi:hypothetical protein
MYDLEHLLDDASRQQANLNGRWVPARPVPFWGWYGFWFRLRDAWAVLTKRADAFRWPEGQ